MVLPVLALVVLVSLWVVPLLLSVVVARPFYFKYDFCRKYCVPESPRPGGDQGTMWPLLLCLECGRGGVRVSVRVVVGTCAAAIWVWLVVVSFTQQKDIFRACLLPVF